MRFHCIHIGMHLFPRITGGKYKYNSTQDFKIDSIADNIFALPKHGQQMAGFRRWCQEKPKGSNGYAR